MQEEMQGEVYLYHLLRRLFLTEPTRELLGEIGALPVQPGDDASVQGITLMVNAVQRNAVRLDAWVEELAVEYSRLFIGPIKPLAVPYGSFYISESHQLMTEETIEVRRRYLDAGMALKELYRVPDDHVGIELEFLYYLANETISLRQKGLEAEAVSLDAMKTDFLTDHMAKWVPVFTGQIVSSTNEDFYKGVASLLGSLFRDPERVTRNETL